MHSQATAWRNTWRHRAHHNSCHNNWWRSSGLSCSHSGLGTSETIFWSFHRSISSTALTRDGFWKDGASCPSRVYRTRLSANSATLRWFRGANVLSARLISVHRAWRRGKALTQRSFSRLHANARLRQRSSPWTSLKTSTWTRSDLSAIMVNAAINWHTTNCCWGRMNWANVITLA